MLDRNYGCEYGEVAGSDQKQSDHPDRYRCALREEAAGRKEIAEIEAFPNGYTIEKGTRMDFENETNE